MKMTTRKLPYRMLVALSGSRVKFDIIVENNYTPITGKPIIFAANHTNGCDMPIILRAVKRHFYVLVGKQRLGFLDRLFFFLIGTVYADRLNKADTSLTKKTLISLLRKGEAVLWFPEGTWNMSDNLLMLPMKWGIIEVAGCAGAQIIPISLAYDRKAHTCAVRFGNPITDPDPENKAAAIRNLRDTMASLRWEQICRDQIVSRAELDLEQARAEIAVAMKEYPYYQLEYERQCIYRQKEDEK